MELKFDLDAREQAGMDAQLDWYNAANPLDPLTQEEYVERYWVRAQLKRLADRYDPATTDDISILRTAVKNDPAAVKEAIEAKEASPARVDVSVP